MSGLSELRRYHKEAAERQADSERPKAEWLKLPEDGSSVTGRFLQEMDEESPLYNKERGIGLVAVEHQAPGDDGWKRRAVCTLETEGRCYACEQLPKNKDWRQRTNYYINFLAEDGKVYIASRGVNSSFVKSLVQEVEDEENITDANYRITRTGNKSTTAWTPKRLKSAPLDDSGVEVYDLNKSAVRHIPYERQAEYYGAVWSDEDPKAKVAADEEW